MFLSKIRNRDESGFSLLEVLITAVIIGVLAAVAVPVVGNLRATGDEGAAKASINSIVTEYRVFTLDGTAAASLDMTVADAVADIDPGTEERIINLGQLTDVKSTVDDVDGALTCVSGVQNGIIAKWTSENGVEAGATGGTLDECTPNP